MTVSLLITKKSDNSDVDVPLATTVTFNSWWMPGIKAIGAKWMETFPYGWDIDFEQLPEVIIELKQFRRWLESIDDAEMREFLYGRVDRLIDTLGSRLIRSTIQERR